MPKSVSGSGVQLLTEPSHCDGASAIHSALETSGLLIESVLENVWPDVSSESQIDTSVPSTVTLEEMWSPAETGRSTRTGALGTSSYHA